MNKIDFTLRIAAAHRYHLFLAKHADSTWTDAFNDIEQEPTFGIPELLVLLHPNWYQQLEINSINDPRGLNSFSAAKSIAKCRANEIWGYECPYQHYPIHIDHTFPFARGGATKPDNAMYLCKEHNLSKSTDLHLLPWETFPSRNWIKEELLFLLNMAGRLSKQKFYFPENQIQQV
jgi:hypothetical protein